ncbi:hypothetical protein BurJ1DRAFT_1258 [Burkholderiales bacterium JOSHI_001]|nr:hypothetical protein BurJ1DRAFT_1258 [Burkholderiales bacterium JOSHI_001]
MLDTESMLLSFDLLEGGARVAAGAPTLAAVIDERLGVTQPAWRISIDALDLQLDASRRLTGGEIRSNPARWSHEALAPPPHPALPGTLTLDAPFDSNGMVSFAGPVRVVIDPTTHVLALKLGRAEAAQWLRLADELLAGCTADGYLCELRLTSPVAP